jgi:hypothetical protein
MDPISEFLKILRRETRFLGWFPRSLKWCLLPHQRLYVSLNFLLLCLVCGALGRINMRLTCATWHCWAKDRIQEETSHATWSRCASVEYFCVFLNTPSFEILLLPLFWRGVMLYSFFYSLWLEHIFSMLLEHILFSMTPLSFRKNTRREISLNFGVFIVGGWMACFA